MKLVADDVQSVVIPGAGHWLAEEAPDEFLAALTAFLAPYRDGDGADHAARQPAGRPGSETDDRISGRNVRHARLCTPTPASDPSRLVYEDAPVPTLGPGDVLVRVHASGVTPARARLARDMAPPRRHPAHATHRPGPRSLRRRGGGRAGTRQVSPSGTRCSATSTSGVTARTRSTWPCAPTSWPRSRPP